MKIINLILNLIQTQCQQFPINQLQQHNHKWQKHKV